MTKFKTVIHILSGIVVFYAGAVSLYQYVNKKPADMQTAEEIQKDKDFEMFSASIQATLEDGCQKELGSVCKDNYGTAAYSCIKDFADKVSPSCKDTMMRIKQRMPANH